LFKIKNKKEAISISNNYFQKRYSGLINQHDVLNAFKGKKLKNKQNFITDYNLDPNKKIVAIMPHIFCDAPHAYPDTLYSDYYEWFINTAKILLENTYINVIVKEHPSANLYNEQGKLEEILRDHNLNLFLINSSENTHSVLQIADVVVTCGGTVGLEFSCAGNPVILAAKPPYSNLGFTYDNSTIQEYTNKLLTCHLLPRLTEIQTDNALLTAFLSYCNNDVDFTRLEIGSETISLGNQYSEDKLYSNIMTFQKTNIENQYIFNYLKSFLNNPNRLGLKL
jgi:capsule polysaccharide export protein KpsC/LpsZ